MKYWFKAKRYGYGWSYPLTWQGWAVYGAYFTSFALFLWWAASNAPPKMSYADHNRISFIAMGIFLLVWTPALVWICAKKGEPARWRWGGKS